MGESEQRQPIASIKSSRLEVILRLIPVIALALAALILIEYSLGVSTGLPAPKLTIIALSAAAVGSFLMMSVIKSVPEAFPHERLVKELRTREDETPSVETPRSEESVMVAYEAHMRLLESVLNNPAAALALALAIAGLVFYTFPSGDELAANRNWGRWFAPINLGILAVAGLVGFQGWRILAIAWGLWRLGRTFNLEAQPHHPDRSGGLRRLGDLCILNALILAIPGSYIGLRSLVALNAPDTQRLLRSFLPVVVALATLTSVGPLWSIHSAMRREREFLLEPQAQEASRLALELLHSRNRIDQPEREEKVRAYATQVQIYEETRRIPTWPFPSTRLSAFATTQFLPVAGLTASIIEVMQPIGSWASLSFRALRPRQLRSLAVPSCSFRREFLLPRERASAPG